jgi:hypothetical protein
MRPIKGLLLAGLMLLLGSSAQASTCPTFAYGMVLTAAQWNACFDSKQNALGYTPVNKAGDIMFGPLGMVASSTAKSGFNIPQGTAPTNPVNGDIWTTTAGVYARINGVTTGPFGTSTVQTNMPNTWTALQTFNNSDIALLGSSTGKTTFTSANAGASDFVLTFPGATDTVATLGAVQTLTNKTLTSPVLTTPTLGAATATSINKMAITAPATSSTLAVADGKTLTASNTLTFTGTDTSSVNFGTGGTVLYSGGSYVSSLTGTANQITVSGSTGAVTISTPAALTFTGKTVTGGTFASPTLSGTVAGAGTIPLSILATQAADTVVANATGGSASPTAVSIGSCSTSSSGLTYNTSTHVFGCNTAINAATLGSATFAAPGPIGSGTPGTGAFTTLSATGAITPSQTNGIIGTTTNNSANAGSVGEYVSSTVLIGSAIPLVAGTANNATSISLTAGDWDVQGDICFTRNSLTNTVAAFGWVSTSSATIPTLPNSGMTGITRSALVGLVNECIAGGTVRFLLSGTTTIYLSGFDNFSASTSAIYGVIGARRVR